MTLLINIYIYYTFNTLHFIIVHCLVYCSANLGKVRGAISELFLRTVAAAARGVQEAPCFRFGVTIKFKGRGISINMYQLNISYEVF